MKFDAYLQSPPKKVPKRVYIPGNRAIIGTIKSNPNMPPTRHADFDYDEEGEDFDLLSNDDDDDSVEEANGDSESDFETEDEEVTAHGKVVDSEDDEPESTQGHKAITEEPPVDIQPAKVSKKKKSIKSKMMADCSPIPISKKPTQKPKAVVPKSAPATATVFKKKVVDVSGHTFAKIFKATVKRENQVSGHVLPQPSTATCRIDTSAKANAINQNLSDLISEKIVTRDNCVKVVTIDTKKDPSGTKPDFVYTFGVRMRICLAVRDKSACSHFCQLL